MNLSIFVQAKQFAEKVGLVASGAKARLYGLWTARLKPCPSTIRRSAGSAAPSKI
jgi:hypothetical protein